MTDLPLSTAAVVVTYNPDGPTLINLVSALLQQVGAVIVSDNGGGKSALTGLVHPQQECLHFVDMGGNLGVGSALNAGFEIAESLGAKYVLTFDQDSEVAADYAAALLKHFLELQAGGNRCAAVGPVFYDRRNLSTPAYPIYNSSKWRIRVLHPQADSVRPLSADVLITSGMLIDIKVWKGGYKYNEGLFVDCTDSEWCFRVRANGYSIFACPDVRLAHALSDAPPVNLLGLKFLHYSSIRRYYFYRNTVFLIRSNTVPLVWKLRLGFGLLVRLVIHPIIDRSPIKSLLAMRNGVRDGFANRLGKSRT